MKKSIFLLAATAVVMASCSNDETIAVADSQAISFDNFVNKTSRANDATLSNVSTMKVCGYMSDPLVQIFTDVVVTKQASGEWTYDPVQFWSAGKNYYFVATASQFQTDNSALKHSLDGEIVPPQLPSDFYGFGSLTFDNQKANGHEDALYAYATASTPNPIASAPDKVQFAFKHILSRVHFTFKNDMSSSAYMMKVKNVVINNAASKGSVALNSSELNWGDFDGSFALKYVDSNKSFGQGGFSETENNFVIPSSAVLNISFDVEVYLNGTLLSTYNHVGRDLPATEFKSGYSYNFIASLDENNVNPGNPMYPIEFNVSSVEGWEDAADSNIEFE